MKFIPYPDKVQVKPSKKDSFFNDDNLLETGTVVAVGKDCKFLKVGDVVFFSSWGVDKTPEQDGEQYYVLQEKSEFILGKLAKDGQVKK